MEKKINKNQEKLIHILRSFDSKKPLSFLVQDSCSEISRLFGCWLLNDTPTARISILKGEGIFGDKNAAHDLLLVDAEGRLHLIDPTIWQFFKNKRKILIGKMDNQAMALDFLKKTYNGTWMISENITGRDCKHEKEWLNIVEQNIKS